MAHKVLVVDVGGTHLKILASGQRTPRKIDSGPKMTAAMTCSWAKKAASGWHYDVASIGYPGPVVHGRPVHEPYNLAKGWVGFDYAKALGCPVKITNDAAMQALGSYHGGRMLFLGLGTGLGSAMIVDGILEPMELAHLPYKKGRTYEDYLGLRGLERMGKKKWRHYVAIIVEELQAALNPDYVVLGGGNVKEIKTLPPKTRLGANGNAFIGGYRLWSEKQGLQDRGPERRFRT
ncbi:MAG TPA: ROK family protein [Terriglobales bacterium]|jgi:polyphosphate glucokinase|nr:ROK family protein [Terriglobales bacterium]